MMIECDTEIIRKGLALLAEKAYDEALNTFEEARNFYATKSASGYLSVSLSLFGLALYLKDKSRYEEVLRILNDARFMAENSKSDTGKIVNEYAKGTVAFGEGLKDTALMYFEHATVMNGSIGYIYRISLWEMKLLNKTNNTEKIKNFSL